MTIRHFKTACLFFVALISLLHFDTALGQAQRLRVSYSAVTANNSPVWIAKEKGLFGKYHLDVQVLLIESGTTSIQALVAGETQIAQLAGGVILSSGLAGSDVVSIAGLENRSAFSLITQKEIKALREVVWVIFEHLTVAATYK